MTAAETSFPLREDPHLEPNTNIASNAALNDGNEATLAPPKNAPPKNAPLKIALLGYRSHPFVGGQGIYLKYLSRALAQLGHQVDVFSGPPYPELDPNISLIKVPSLDLFEAPSHVRALRPRHLRSWTDTFEWWSMLSGGFAEPYTFGRRVKKLLQQRSYDIIHDNQSLSFALVELQNAGFNVTTTIHHPIHRDRDIALAQAQKWGERLLIRRWYSFLSMQEKVVSKLQHVSTVSSVSQGDIARFFARSREKTPVIPNGVDTDTFVPLPEITRLPFRVITTSSSDQPLKGLRFLLEAIAQLREKYPRIELRIIGKLKERGSSQTLIEDLHLGDHISCVDGISTESLVEEYARASVAVCPSLYEGFGLPAAEAMACGLPVIVSDGGALPEVVGNAGDIVPAGNSHAIAHKIEALFSDPQTAKRRGTRARAHTVENFSWLKVAQQLSCHYRDIIARADS